LKKIGITISQHISEGDGDPGFEDKCRARMMLRPENGYLHFRNIYADRLPSLHKDVGKPDEVTAVPSGQLLHDTSHLKSRVLENAMPDQILTKLKQQP
jgi:hypothetical protein